MVAPADAKADAGLEVRGVEQRDRGDGLQAVESRRGLERLSEDDGAVGRVQQHGRRRFRCRRTRGSRRRG